MSVEDFPEFQRALNEACEKQYRGCLYGGEYAKAHSKDTIADTMEEMQRRRKEIEAKADDIRKHAEQVRKEAKIRSNPHMREIGEIYRRKHGSGGLICPLCGERDHGNRMGNTPICYNIFEHKKKGVDGPVPLMTAEKAKGWKPPAKKHRFKEPYELGDDEIVRVK